MFGSAQSFLAFLVALATVCGVVRVFGLKYIVKSCRDFARQMGTFGCALFLCAFVMLAGFAVSKEPMRSSPSPMMPEWFSALGYNATDTDGDGIPDCWERWTRTNPRVADDAQDMDGDGVDNYAEFWHQCDPALADTDGDGYSDYVEIAGQAVGKTWYDPLVRATYVHEEPDTNANGVPDHWENTDYVYGFTDANGDGLPDGVPFPDVGGGNFDVTVTVTTSRSALLTWGDGVTNGIVLAPCTGLVVRVRLAKAVETNIRLAAGLPNDGSDDLWDASYSVTWASGRNQQTEGNRIRLGDGSIIDIDGEATVSFRGEVVSVPMRGGNGGDYPPSPIPLRLKWLDVNCTDGLCWEHDPGGFSAVAIYTNVVPPFAWYVNGYLVPNVYGDILGGYDIFNHWDGLDSPEVRCVATNGPLHEAILVEDSDYAGMGHCPPGATNLFPITELVGYDVVTNHAPDKTDPTPAKYGPNCPETETLDIWAGFAHGGAKPWARNFETIPTGNDDDDATSHCHAIDWSDGLEIDLEEYLPNWLLNYKDKLRFRVNGDPISGTTIPPSKKPADLEPEIYHVEMCDEENATLDRLWIVMLNPDTRIKFSAWVSENATNATWLASLPKPPSRIFVNVTGEAALPSAASSNWCAPELFPANSFMHPKAVFELRSNVIIGGHGHQATYDAQGMLITESIKAGTADYASPSNKKHLIRVWNHRDEDVRPYIRALQLDGNPVIPVDNSGNSSTFWTRNLSRPPLRVGPFTQQYLNRRPTTPSGVQPIP